MLAGDEDDGQRYTGEHEYDQWSAFHVIHV
jgi:hypothetical protein